MNAIPNAESGSAHNSRPVCPSFDVKNSREPDAVNCMGMDASLPALTSAASRDE
jgi:hypothetical protein